MGDTALHIAVQNRRYEAVQALLEADVNTTIKNRRNRKAEDMADAKIKEIFEKHRLYESFRKMREDFDDFKQSTNERFGVNEATLDDVIIRLKEVERKIHLAHPRQWLQKYYKKG